jgi:hypothetical protein
LQAVDEQNHFASTVQVTFVFSTCPSSAFGEAHVPLLPSALDLQPLQNKPKVLDAWISLPSQNMTIKLRRREANKGVFYMQKKPTI